MKEDSNVKGIYSGCYKNECVKMLGKVCNYAGRFYTKHVTTRIPLIARRYDYELMIEPRTRTITVARQCRNCTVLSSDVSLPVKFVFQRICYDVTLPSLYHAREQLSTNFQNEFG